ncbi:DNA-binding domain-containing protein [Pannonibacter sp. Pt2-lr]
MDEGRPRDIAMMEVSRMFGVSERTLWNWRQICYGRPSQDWLAHLVPAYVGRQAEADCTPEAWDFIRADYLRQEQPPFTDCYRRLAAVAAERGWTIPSERTLARRMDALPGERQGSGAQAAARPAAHVSGSGARQVGHAAAEAVNADGHKFDVFVAWPGEKAPVRPVLVVWQDIYSGKILSWRLDRSENAMRCCWLSVTWSRRGAFPSMRCSDNGRNFCQQVGWTGGGEQPLPPQGAR